MERQASRVFILSAVITMIITGACTAMTMADDAALTPTKLLRTYPRADSIMAIDGVQMEPRDPDKYASEGILYRADNGGALRRVAVLNLASWSFDDDGYPFTNSEDEKCYLFKNTTDDRNFLILDYTVQPGVRYQYRFEERDWWGNVLSSSNVLDSVVLKIDPTFMRLAVRTGSSRIKVCWFGKKYGSGYEVYRQKNNGPWKRIKTINNINKMEYIDKSAKTGSTYSYKVRVYQKRNGKIEYSNFSDIWKINKKKASVKGNYKKGSVYGPDLTKKELAEVRNAVQSFKDHYITKQMTDEQKVFFAYMYMLDNCSYETRGPLYNHANTAWGALICGKAQCSGYARAMKALCDAMGVKCKYVHANKKSIQPSHQWVQVKVDGKWYVIDAQSRMYLVGHEQWWKYAGLRWNTKGLPKLAKDNHKKAMLNTTLIGQQRLPVISFNF